MKRYWLFGFMDFYPQGGMDDFLGAFETEQEAIRSFLSQKSGDNNYQIVDAETQGIIRQGCRWNLEREFPSASTSQPG